MQLEIAGIGTDEMMWGTVTRLLDHTLEISSDELRSLLGESEPFRLVDIGIVRAGEDVRVINVLDSIAPLVAADANTVVYPGLAGKAAVQSGSGKIDWLEGVRVVTCGEFPDPPSGVLGTKPGLIDMSGSGVDYCDGARSANVVISVAPNGSASNEEFDSGVRSFAHRVSQTLAETVMGCVVDTNDSFELLQGVDGLPNVVYVLQLQDQGPLIRPLLYGHPIGEDFVPTLIHPNELLAGAVVSANYRSCMKMSSYQHVRNPVVLELYRRHRHDLNFAGVVISRGHHANHFLKERSAQYVAKLAGLLNADCAVITMEGTGNGTLDFMLTVQALEQTGVRTSGVMHELAGSLGTDPSLVDGVDSADSLVSVGNVNEEISVGRPRRVIGGDALQLYNGVRVPADAVGPISAMECFGSFCAMGASALQGVEY